MCERQKDKFRLIDNFSILLINNQTIDYYKFYTSKPFLNCTQKMLDKMKNVLFSSIVFFKLKFHHFSLVSKCIMSGIILENENLSYIEVKYHKNDLFKWCQHMCMRLSKKFFMQRLTKIQRILTC